MRDLLRQTETFPATTCVLLPGALAALAEKEYGLIPLVQCEYFSKGLNDTYQVNSGSGRHILRAYTQGWRAEEEILWELALLEDLKAVQVPVAAPIRTRDGRLLLSLSAVEGRRFVVLFE